MRSATTLSRTTRRAGTSWLGTNRFGSSLCFFDRRNPLAAARSLPTLHAEPPVADSNPRSALRPDGPERESLVATPRALYANIRRSVRALALPPSRSGRAATIMHYFQHPAAGSQLWRNSAIAQARLTTPLTSASDELVFSGWPEPYTAGIRSGPAPEAYPPKLPGRSFAPRDGHSGGE